jgi:hypothetical protein
MPFLSDLLPKIGLGQRTADKVAGTDEKYIPNRLR